MRSSNRHLRLLDVAVPLVHVLGADGVLSSNRRHGDNIFVRGQVQDKVWTWSDEVMVEGKKMKIVATVIEESPTSTSFKLEAGVDGGPMTLIEQGKSTKVGKTT